MLKTNELRIGNRITYAGKEVIVEGIVGNTIYHSNGQFDQNNEPAYEAFKCILLNEQLLLRAGFKGTSACLFLKAGYISDMEESFIHAECNDCWYNGAGYSIGIWITDLESNMHMDTYSTNYFEFESANVHQLQNLYFALTGEDLVFSSTEP